MDRTLIEEGIIDYLSVKDGKFSYPDFDSRTFCPLCLIKKHYKVRHVKKVNLCVKDFHFYSKFFDKIVFGKNHIGYMISLLLNLLCVVLLIFLTLHVYSRTSGKPFFMFFVEFLELDMRILSMLVFVINLLLAPSYAIDFMIQAYCILTNVTYDELLRPQHYAYLYPKKEGKVAVYKNPNDFGLVKNIKIFIRRLI